MGRVESDLGSDLHWYGGDAKVVATRGEIERVIAELTALDSWLRAQVEPQDFLVEPVHRLRLAMELPPILERIGHIRDACIAASDGYFDGETEISRELRAGVNPPIPALALGLIGAGGLFGLFRETQVSANLVQVDEGVSPPRSIRGLADRLSSTAGVADGWLRIEKYFEPATPVGGAQIPQMAEAKYLVYIPGTQTWAAKPGENPLDATSNLSAISKTGSAGSERAVAAAMKQAGIGASDQVLFIGHSQGGMVAANLALGYSRAKVLTFGAPLGQLTDQSKAPTLAVEHDRDAVPKVDGRPNPIRADWVTVRQEIAGTDPVAQHQMKGYAETAAVIDRQKLPLTDQIANFAGRSAGTALYFEMKRNP